MNATSVYYLCTKEPWLTFRDKTSIVVYKVLLLGLLVSFSGFGIKVILAS